MERNEGPLSSHRRLPNNGPTILCSKSCLRKYWHNAKTEFQIGSRDFCVPTYIQVYSSY